MLQGIFIILLSFLGMESISPDALGALLHNFKGRLALGLMELTVDIARELAQAHRDIFHQKIKVMFKVC